MSERIKKATRHTNQNEGLIFEKSSPGKRAFELPPLDVPAVDPAKALGDAFRRGGVEGFPEVSEIEVIRHFTRLSTWNYAIDLGMYPLGSCTMKYNPRVNEFVARLNGIATEHPYQPHELSQGCLRILQLLEKCLLEITGMDTITLQPAADSRVPHEKWQSAQKGSDPRLRARHQSGNRRDRRLRSRKHQVQRRGPG
jgi:glycine dehydrogenase subunit 2